MRIKTYSVPLNATDFVQVALPSPVELLVMQERSGVDVLLVTQPDAEESGWGDIGDLSRANPCVVTKTGHGLVTGDIVFFANIQQEDWTALNGPHPVTKLTDNTFSVPVNTSGYSAAYVPSTDPGVLRAACYFSLLNPLTVQGARLRDQKVFWAKSVGTAGVLEMLLVC